MVGIPKKLQTKQDWLNAVEYAKASGDGIGSLIEALHTMKDNSKMLVLKASAANKEAEDQTPEDFQAVDDPGCEKIRLGFSDEEIENLIGGLV
jgi:hypothetical protein